MISGIFIIVNRFRGYSVKESIGGYMKFSVFSLFRGAILQYSWKVLLNPQIYKLVFETILNQWGLYKLPVKELHDGYLRGEYTEELIFSLLYPDQVDEFIEYHEVRKLHLLGGFDRQLASRFARIDGMIERDLEANIDRKRKKVNVVKRID